MKPFIPYKEELDHILTLEKGQTFVIARPVEPQPLEDTIRHEKADGETWLFFDGGNPPLHHYRKNPFGKEGEEFWAINEDDQYHGCLTGDCPHTVQGECDFEIRELAVAHLRNAGTEVKRVQGLPYAQCVELVGYLGNTPMIDNVSLKFKKQWQSRFGDQYHWQGNPWAFLTTMEVR